MCGIVGIYSETHVASSIYDSLLMLQHRGQDAAGMVVCDETGRLNSRKSMGYVRDTFQQRHMNKLLGNYGIGHVRYPTAGGAGKEFAQQMYVNSPYGISLAHNGNLTKDGLSKKEYIVASENASFSALGFKTLRDVYPGEAVYIDTEGNLHSDQCSDIAEPTPCIFEYVYLARPDSTLDEISVYKARMRMGQRLAKKILKLNPEHDIDVVIPIPDSSTTAALQLAAALKLPYRQGFVKNRYVGRTFIMPNQEERKKSVRRKLNILDLEFKGKNVLLVDDSIVRGTTSKRIIEMAKEAGANKVYFSSAAPPVKFQNLYGIDMAATNELIASGRTDEEVAKEIGADWLIYQDLDDLIASAQEGNPSIQKFEMSIFDGIYPTSISSDYLEDLESSRGDNQKVAREKSS